MDSRGAMRPVGKRFMTETPMSNDLAYFFTLFADGFGFIHSQFARITTFETRGLELLFTPLWTRQSKSKQYRKSLRGGGSNAESYGAFTARGVGQSKS